VHIFWSIQKIISYNSTQFFSFVMSVNLHVVTSDSDENILPPPLIQECILFYLMPVYYTCVYYLS